MIPWGPAGTTWPGGGSGVSGLLRQGAARIRTPPARAARIATRAGPSSDCRRIFVLFGSANARGHEGTSRAGSQSVTTALGWPSTLSASPRAGQSRCALTSSCSQQPSGELEGPPAVAPSACRRSHVVGAVSPHHRRIWIPSPFGSGRPFVVAKQLWGEDRVAFEDPAGSLRDTLSSATGARPKPGLEGGGGFKSLTAHHKIKTCSTKEPVQKRPWWWKWW